MSTIPNAKSVLRAMVKRNKNLKKLAKATGIDRELLRSFRRGGDLSGLKLQRLTSTLLRRQAEYTADTDTLTAKEDR